MSEENKNRGGFPPELIQAIIGAITNQTDFGPGFDIGGAVRDQQVGHTDRMEKGLFATQGQGDFMRQKDISGNFLNPFAPAPRGLAKWEALNDKPAGQAFDHGQGKLGYVPPVNRTEQEAASGPDQEALERSTYEYLAQKFGAPDATAPAASPALASVPAPANVQETVPQPSGPGSSPLSGNVYTAPFSQSSPANAVPQPPTVSAPSPAQAQGFRQAVNMLDSPQGTFPGSVDYASVPFAPAPTPGDFTAGAIPMPMTDRGVIHQGLMGLSGGLLNLSDTVGSTLFGSTPQEQEAQARARVHRDRAAQRYVPTVR